MKTIRPSRGEILAKAMLKDFFRVDPQAPPRPLARQPKPADDLLLPLKPDPADWRAELHKLVDDFEAGKVQFHPAGLVCNGDFCWYSRLVMSGR